MREANSTSFEGASAEMIVSIVLMARQSDHPHLAERIAEDRTTDA